MEYLILGCIAGFALYLKGRHDGRAAKEREIRGSLGYKEDK